MKTYIEKKYRNVHVRDDAVSEKQHRPVLHAITNLNGAIG